MTPEQRECMDSMPVWLLDDGTLPRNSPSASKLNEWEANGWILLIDEPPRKRWALTPMALANW
jgi:hypothetical protein